MSSDTFEDELAIAADCYVAQYGLDEALAKLEARRHEPDAAPDRAEAALAYLKREYGGADL
jgi:hypothetical protein